MTDTIFKPQYDQKQLESLINAIANNAWLVERMLLMPKHELWFKRDVQIARAAATTQIEGASLSEEDVSALVREVRAGKLTQDEQANLNAIAAYDFVDYLSDQRDIPVDELAIRELNRQFLRGAPEALTPGAYRKGQNKVGTNYDPPNQGDVPALMRDFVVWLNADDEIDVVIKAALAHLQFVAIHPFWDGNGRTARALATLILQRSSRHSFRKLLSLEQSFAQTRDEYFTAIERSVGPSYRSDYDAMPFLEFFTTALTAHSILLTQRLTEWHRSMEHVQAAFSAVDINHRQAEALAYATKAGRLTRSDYLEITRTSPVTASRDLADLVAKGWLKPEGRTRGRVYRMVQRQESTGQPPIEEPADQPRLFGKNA